MQKPVNNTLQLRAIEGWLSLFQRWSMALVHSDNVSMDLRHIWDIS